MWGVFLFGEPYFGQSPFDPLVYNTSGENIDPKTPTALAPANRVITTMQRNTPVATAMNRSGKTSTLYTGVNKQQTRYNGTQKPTTTY